MKRAILKKAIAIACNRSGITNTYRRVCSKMMPSFVMGVNYHDTPSALEVGFREHVAFMNSEFEIISEPALVQFFAGELRLQRPGLILCFDDGFLGNYEMAASVLDEHDMKGWFFIVVGRVGGADERTGARYMNWEHIAELSRRGHSIGCHTYSHRKVSEIPSKELWRELINSKENIEDKIGREVTSFCYTYGGSDSYDRTSLKLLKEHYRFVFNSCPRMHLAASSPFSLGRNNIEAGWSLDLVKFVTSGLMNGKYLYRGMRFDSLNRSA